MCTTLKVSLFNFFKLFSYFFLYILHDVSYQITDTDKDITCNIYYVISYAIL